MTASLSNHKPEHGPNPIRCSLPALRYGIILYETLEEGKCESLSLAYPHPRRPLWVILLQFLFALFFPTMHLATACREKPYSREWGHYAHTKGHLEKEQCSQFKLWLPESRPIGKKG